MNISSEINFDTRPERDVLQIDQKRVDLLEVITALWGTPMLRHQESLYNGSELILPAGCSRETAFRILGVKEGKGGDAEWPGELLLSNAA